MAERVASALKLGDDADFFQPREFSICRSREGHVSASPVLQQQRLSTRLL